MGPWDHYSCSELFSDLSEAHIHAGLHLKERDCLYKQFWREHKMSTFCEVLHPFSTEGFETLKNAKKSFNTFENQRTAITSIPFEKRCIETHTRKEQVIHLGSIANSRFQVCNL